MAARPAWRCTRDSLQARCTRRAGCRHPRSTAFGYVTVAMSYLSPDRIFAFSSFPTVPVAIFVYVLIAVAELRLRRRLESEMPERLRMRMWGLPVAHASRDRGDARDRGGDVRHPEQRASLLFGLVSVAVLLSAYALRGLVRVPAQTAR